MPLAKKVQAYLEEKRICKTVAIMGCIVNGPGEAKHADIGLAGGRGQWVMFKKGVPCRTLREDEAFDALVSELEKM